MTQSQNTVLLFGPQALSFEQESFNQIRSTLLPSPQYKRVLDIIAELPNLFTTAAENLPKLKSTSGKRLLHDLNDWLHSGNINEPSFQLPNILLSPLVVTTHLIECARYIRRRQIRLRTHAGRDAAQVRRPLPRNGRLTWPNRRILYQRILEPHGASAILDQIFADLEGTTQISTVISAGLPSTKSPALYLTCSWVMQRQITQFITSTTLSDSHGKR